jgi:hypothetical protein
MVFRPLTLPLQFDSGLGKRMFGVGDTAVENVANARKSSMETPVTWAVAITMSWGLVWTVGVVFASWMWFLYGLDLTPDISADDAPPELWRPRVVLITMTLLTLLIFGAALVARAKMDRVIGLILPAAASASLTVFWAMRF